MSPTRKLVRAEQRIQGRIEGDLPDQETRPGGEPVQGGREVDLPRQGVRDRPARYHNVAV